MVSKSSVINKYTNGQHLFFYCLAMNGGFLLTLLVHMNALIAKNSNAIISSWVVHASGTCCAIMILPIKNTITLKTKHKIPLWVYCGGMLGAIVMILNAVCVNSVIGLTGTISLVIFGQTLFAICIDGFGWFGHDKHRISWRDFLVMILVSLGCLIIFY